ncbi:DUF3014 domain-containing protein [Ferrimonas aestuarii]|uniref:DUF3014 domain-containing protein n=1 Tax=Ferrimonas aestuarii TaxID=2569539 RepID=A0A4U1BNW8_9GAMM|nr:DUF3014 domain-containing protein [Ferrimonas aestuarii]TKB51789.1 DUF3014 domain-containing protein [Ferrimonas aestuarii]
MNQNQSDSSRPNTVLMAGVAVVILVSIGAWFYLANEPEKPQANIAPIEPVIEPIVEVPSEPLPTEPVVEPEPEPLLPPEPEPEVTVEPEPTPEPVEPAVELPRLSESDDFAKAQLNSLADGMQLGQFLIPDSLVRRFVSLVDNLAQGEVLRKQGPFKPLSEPFKAVEVSGQLYLDPDGHHRYDAYTSFLYRLDERALRDTFLLLEPLFEEAYSELGYEDSFRNRLDDAIDLILSAPELDTALALESYSVNYEYRDEDLQSLTDVEKMMLRMGPDNARKLKSTLRRFRAAMND